MQVGALLMKLPFFGGRESKSETPGLDVPIPPGASLVLMVDDEPAQRQLFAFALRREGYHVLEARNGVEALEVADKAGRLDLVVTDIVMPVMKGPELAARLRDRFPGLQVVFV
jgi:two-component system cell cycle sensor histidine kinase/response regulator CckA